MEYDITRAKELIQQREEIDAELAVIFGGRAVTSTTRKPQVCGTCGEAGHPSRTCPKKQSEQHQTGET